MAAFVGAGRKWAAPGWKLPERRHRYISQIKNLRKGFQSRTEGRIQRRILTGSRENMPERCQESPQPKWIKGGKEGSFVAHSAQGPAISRVTPKERAGQGLIAPPAGP